MDEQLKRLLLGYFFTERSGVKTETGITGFGNTVRSIEMMVSVSVIRGTYDERKRGLVKQALSTLKGYYSGIDFATLEKYQGNSIVDFLYDTQQSLERLEQTLKDFEKAVEANAHLSVEMPQYKEVVAAVDHIINLDGKDGATGYFKRELDRLFGGEEDWKKMDPLHHKQ